LFKRKYIDEENIKLPIVLQEKKYIDEENIKLPIVLQEKKLKILLRQSEIQNIN